MQKIKQSLKEIDIFGQPVSLNMENEDSYKTSVGGFFTLVIIITFSIFFKDYIVSFFEQSQIQVNVNDVYQSEPDQIILDDSNYLFALALTQSNKDFISRPYFNVTVEQRRYTKLENGTTVKEIIPIDLVPCKLKRFQNLFQKQGIDYEDQFKRNGFSNFLCPKKGYNLTMKGIFTNDIFEFIKIDIKQCVNTTTDNPSVTQTDNNNKWNPSCAMPEQIQKDLLAQGSVKLSLYTTNWVVNPQYPQDYKTFYLNDELHFDIVPKKVLKLIDVYHKKYNFQTDTSVLPTASMIYDEFSMRDYQDFREVVNIGSETDKSYTTVYLRRSQFSVEVTRSYEKIDQVLSYLGGFIQSLILVIGFFMAFYNRQQLIIDLCNKMYEFRISEKDQKMDSKNLQLEKNFNKKQRQNSLKSQVRVNPINEPQLRNLEQSNGGQSIIELDQKTDPATLQLCSSRQKLQSKNRQEYLLENLKKLIGNKKKLQFSFKLLLNRISCNKLFKNDQNCELLEEAMVKMNKNLNVYDLIMKIKEIDKLKDLMLNKQQRIIFNYCAKPVLGLKNLKKSKAKNRKLMPRFSFYSSVNKVVDMSNNNLDYYTDIKALEKLYQAYTRVKDFQKFQSKKEEMKYNQVLMSNISAQLVHIFEVAQQFKNDDFEPSLKPKFREKLITILARIRNQKTTDLSQGRTQFINIKDDYMNQIKQVVSPKIVDESPFNQIQKQQNYKDIGYYSEDRSFYMKNNYETIFHKGEED